MLVQMGWLCRYHDIDSFDDSDPTEAAKDLCVQAWNDDLCKDEFQELIEEYTEALVEDRDNTGDDDMMEVCCRILDVSDDEPLEFVVAAVKQGFFSIDEDDDMFKPSEMYDLDPEVREWRMEVYRELFGG